MNLQNNPTIAELVTIFASRNDLTDSHILWVNHQGEVFLDPIRNNLTPAGWDDANNGRYKFRFESYLKGNGYVGITASQDMNWMNRVFNGLTTNWNNGTTGFIDVY